MAAGRCLDATDLQRTADGGKSFKAARQWMAKSQWRKPPLTGPLQVPVALSEA
jgi:hypothetical protein